MKEIRLTGLTAAAPGWYAVYEDDGEEWWTPLACWVIESELDEELGWMDSVIGIDMTGEGADGTGTGSNLVRYDVEANKPASQQ